jgi:hypothetical protein
MTDAPARGELFERLFDDAAMFPPAQLPVAQAVSQHRDHRGAWYRALVGPFVCAADRPAAVAEQAACLGLDTVDVALAVAEGVAAVPAALAGVDRAERLRLRAVETPLGALPMRECAAMADDLGARGAELFLELPVDQVDEDRVRELRAGGAYLKLRTGGAAAGAFPTEDALARAVVHCAGEGLRFKCTAGLHNAVRHRDPQTGFEHHGFLNIALAAGVALTTGDLAAVREVLADQDSEVLAARTRDLSPADVTAIRGLFASIGTCSVGEPLADLTALRLVAAA